MVTDLILRLRALFRRSAVEHELDEELRFHLERQVEAYEEAGLDHAEAVRRARLEFGAVEQVKEEYRDALGVRLMDDLRRDLRLAVRSLRGTPVAAYNPRSAKRRLDHGRSVYHRRLLIDTWPLP